MTDVSSCVCSRCFSVDDFFKKIFTYNYLIFLCLFYVCYIYVRKTDVIKNLFVIVVRYRFPDAAV